MVLSHEDHLLKRPSQVLPIQPAKMTQLLMLLFVLTSVNHVECGSQDDIYREQSRNQWFKDGVDLTKRNFQLRPNTNPAKNVILFIGDGMGISTTTAARIFDGQTKHQSGEENVLSWEEFPYTALSKTYNTDAQVADSAGTATAYATGVKTRKGVLGVNEKVVMENCNSSIGNEVLSILTYAELAGLSTGLVTNTRVSHATPAAFYSHTPSRNWEHDEDKQGSCKDIARQLIEYPYGDGLEVAFGGGWRHFLPCGSIDPQGKKLEKKCRSDGRNLTDEWLKKYNNSEFVWNKDQLKNIDSNKVDHLLGLFASSGLSYDIKREEDRKTSEPDLIEMTKKAIQILSKNPKGFFLMVEGGEIDWGHHSGKAHLALSETAVLAKAVKSATELTKPDDTLIIVTADHSHSFVLYGYVKRGNPIFGFQQYDYADGKPGLTLSYANGPGGLKRNKSRQNLTGINYNDTDFSQQALIRSRSESHAGEDVGIYATGPFAHLFHGVVEQNYIFHVMDYALCLTKSKQEFCTKPQARGGPNTNSASVKLPFTLHLVFTILVLVNYF